MALPPALKPISTRLSHALAQRLPDDRWGRIRLMALAAWVVVSLVGLGIASRDPTANDLGARVSVVHTGLGTALVLGHQGERPWEDLTVSLEPGGWQHRPGTVRPGDRVTLEVGAFTRLDPQGESHAPVRLVPTAVSLATRRGQVWIDLQGR